MDLICQALISLSAGIALFPWQLLPNTPLNKIKNKCYNSNILNNYNEKNGICRDTLNNINCVCFFKDFFQNYLTVISEEIFVKSGCYYYELIIIYILIRIICIWKCITKLTNSLNTESIVRNRSAMALFGMVWLLKVRRHLRCCPYCQAHLRTCSECSLNNALICQHQQERHQQPEDQHIEHQQLEHQQLQHQQLEHLQPQGGTMKVIIRDPGNYEVYHSSQALSEALAVPGPSSKSDLSHQEPITEEDQLLQLGLKNADTSQPRSRTEQLNSSKIDGGETLEKRLYYNIDTTSDINGTMPSDKTFVNLTQEQQLFLEQQQHVLQQQIQIQQSVSIFNPKVKKLAPSPGSSSNNSPGNKTISQEQRNQQFASTDNSRSIGNFLSGHREQSFAGRLGVSLDPTPGEIVHGCSDIAIVPAIKDFSNVGSSSLDVVPHEFDINISREQRTFLGQTEYLTNQQSDISVNKHIIIKEQKINDSVIFNNSAHRLLGDCNNINIGVDNTAGSYDERSTDIVGGGTVAQDNAINNIVCAEPSINVLTDNTSSCCIAGSTFHSSVQQPITTTAADNNPSDIISLSAQQDHNSTVARNRDVRLGNQSPIMIPALSSPNQQNNRFINSSTSTVNNKISNITTYTEKNDHTNISMVTGRDASRYISKDGSSPHNLISPSSMSNNGIDCGELLGNQPGAISFSGYHEYEQRRATSRTVNLGGVNYSFSGEQRNIERVNSLKFDDRTCNDKLNDQLSDDSNEFTKTEPMENLMKLENSNWRASTLPRKFTFENRSNDGSLTKMLSLPSPRQCSQERGSSNEKLDSAFTNNFTNIMKLSKTENSSRKKIQRDSSLKGSNSVDQLFPLSVDNNNLLTLDPRNLSIERAHNRSSSSSVSCSKNTSALDSFGNLFHRGHKLTKQTSSPLSATFSCVTTSTTVPYVANVPPPAPYDQGSWSVQKYQLQQSKKFLLDNSEKHPLPHILPSLSKAKKVVSRSVSNLISSETSTSPKSVTFSGLPPPPPPTTKKIPQPRYTEEDDFDRNLPPPPPPPSGTIPLTGIHYTQIPSNNRSSSTSSLRQNALLVNSAFQSGIRLPGQSMSCKILPTSMISSLHQNQFVNRTNISTGTISTCNALNFVLPLAPLPPAPTYHAGVWHIPTCSHTSTFLGADLPQYPPNRVPGSDKASSSVLQHYSAWELDHHLTWIFEDNLAKSLPLPFAPVISEASSHVSGYHYRGSQAPNTSSSYQKHLRTRSFSIDAPESNSTYNRQGSRRNNCWKEKGPINSTNNSISMNIDGVKCDNSVSRNHVISSGVGVANPRVGHFSSNESQLEQCSPHSRLSPHQHNLLQSRTEGDPFALHTFRRKSGMLLVIILRFVNYLIRTMCID